MLKMQAEKKGGGRNVPVVGGEPGEPVKKMADHCTQC